MTGKKMFFDRTLFRFILTGMVNTIFGAAIMFTLYNYAGFSYWLSSALNYTLASILSFFLNKYFTFGIKNWSARMICFFALTIAVSYIAAYAAAKPLVYALTPAWDKKVRDNIAMLAGTVFFTGINYMGQRFIVFRQDKSGEHNDEN